MSTQPQPVMIKPQRKILGLNTSGSGSTGQQNPQTGAITVNTVEHDTAIIADAVVEERHSDEMVVTEHPVEVGSVVADHAYKLPARLELHYAWARGSPQNKSLDQDFLNNLYNTILGIEAGRILCNVTTGKRTYGNMLIVGLSTMSDKENENILSLRIAMQEILMASTQQVELTPAAVQAAPQRTGPVASQGPVGLQPASNFNAPAFEAIP